METANDSPFDIENQYLPLVTSMTKELSSLYPLSSGCCIYRVPYKLRCRNEQAYTPQVVSIGPLHHGTEALRAMEEHKWRYLEHFIRKTQVGLQDYIDVVKEREGRVRNCYSDSIAFSRDDFVKLILLDAVFIIEILLRFSFEEFGDEVDRIYGKPRNIGSIVLDLLLLENQIPLFIIQDIYRRAQASGFNVGRNGEISIDKLWHIFFKGTYSFAEIEELEVNFPDSEHMVDLVRKFYIPLKPANGGRGRLKNRNVPTVTGLHHAGVRLKVGAGTNLFDIKFHNGILEIPKLNIYNYSEVLARNILAYEQCHYTSSSNYYLTHYFVLMERLVKAPHDLELLVKHGIVEHTLSNSSKVSTLIQSQVVGVAIDMNNFYFASLCENLQEYCRGSWHQWKANLRLNYFNTPWAIISVVAAAAILVLTFIQTVCSFLSLKTH